MRNTLTKAGLKNRGSAEALQSQNPFRITSCFPVVSEKPVVRTTDVMELLVSNLGKGDDSNVWQKVRQKAYETLVAIGEASIENVAKNCDDPNWRVRANIALTLGHMLNSKKSQEVLLKLSRDEDRRVRLFVVESLIMRNHRTAKKLLSALAKDSDNEVALRAEEALKEISQIKEVTKDGSK